MGTPGLKSGFQNCNLIFWEIQVALHQINI